MIRVWGSLILAAALSYWTVGFVALRVFRDVLRWPFHDADQAAFVAILIGTPLLWPAVWFAGRLLFGGRGGSADAFGSAAFMGPKTLLIQVFNVNDMDTASWVSKALGDTTEVYSTGSTGYSSNSGDGLGEGTSSEGSAVHLARRALLTPDEVRRLDPDKAILFKAGARPILARKVRYHADPEFQGLFEEDTRQVTAIASAGNPVPARTLSRRS